MACPDKCCTLRVSDIRPTDVEPVFIDANDWLESVGATQLGSATWTAVAPTGVITNLTISDETVHKGENTATATITGGQGGELYQVNVTLESCEGYRTTICFQQYVVKCA